MRRLTAILGAAFALLAIPVFSPLAAHEEVGGEGWSFAIHGGAGTMARDRMSDEQRAAYMTALSQALEAGSAVLREGGTAMDAVEAAIVLMEDDEKFNAGRGAVFTWEGRNELDASVMDGRDRSAGAVTGVTTVRHPIQLARAVMKDGRHVFLSGEGAEEFARDPELGVALETVLPGFFETERRREALFRFRTEEVSALDVDHKFGTVGAVALDQSGNLAAGTSTGGMTGKRWGRIGDSPIIGAGTYADNRACAVSATGSGEYFIRANVASEICARIRLAGDSAQAAADGVMADMASLGGTGGVIVAAPNGEVIFSFNTSGMYRGRATHTGASEVAIYGEVEPEE